MFQRGQGDCLQRIAGDALEPMCPAELRAGLKSVGLPLGDEDFLRLLAVVDPMQRGRVTYSDFCETLGLDKASNGKESPAHRASQSRKRVLDSCRSLGRGHDKHAAVRWGSMRTSAEGIKLRLGMSNGESPMAVDRPKHRLSAADAIAPSLEEEDMLPRYRPIRRQSSSPASRHYGRDYRPLEAKGQLVALHDVSSCLRDVPSAEPETICCHDPARIDRCDGALEDRRPFYVNQERTSMRSNGSRALPLYLHSSRRASPTSADAPPPLIVRRGQIKPFKATRTRSQPPFTVQWYRRVLPAHP